MFRMKVYQEEGEVLVAASDAAIVGETFAEGGAELSVAEGFYGEDPADADDVLRHLQACTMANLVGEDVVTLAIEHGYVDPEAVARVDGVPHAQIALMRER